MLLGFWNNVLRVLTGIVLTCRFAGMVEIASANIESVTARDCRGISRDT
jgi:hypothetical protein